LESGFSEIGWFISRLIVAFDEVFNLASPLSSDSDEETAGDLEPECWACKASEFSGSSNWSCRGGFCSVISPWSVLGGSLLIFVDGATVVDAGGQAKDVWSGAHRGSSPWAAHHAVAAATVAAAIAVTLGGEPICLDGKDPWEQAGESAEDSTFAYGQNVAAKLAAAWAAGCCSKVETIRLENVEDMLRKDW